MMKLIFVFGLFALAFAAPNARDGKDVIVVLKQKTYPVLDALKTQRFSSRTHRINSVVNALKSHSESSQKSVLEFLSTQNVEKKALWINNQIIVKNADASLIENLKNLADVESVEDVVRIPLEEVRDSKLGTKANGENEWGIIKIGADQVWAKGVNGSGIRVGTIDTGVRYTHKALYETWVNRDSKGWFDPYSSSPLPIDTNGHGTHTMGTIVGQGGIGVAPGAQWMACRGCDTSSCSTDSLLDCGQFMLCPTNPDGTDEDCSLAPRLVSNSWGGGGGQTFYNGIIAAWKTAGIIPLFSNGNSGPSCGTVGSPADYPDQAVIGVGSSTSDEVLSTFSSLGPSVHGEIKPDITAPGSDVNSAWYTGDEAYNSISGTSMACPHAAGVVALILSTDPSLDYDQVAAKLYQGATHTIPASGRNCGGVSETEYPNNSVGWGRLSAVDSVL